MKWTPEQRDVLKLAESARAANAAELARGGTLVAELKRTLAGRPAPELEATVHCRWRADRFYSEIVVNTPIDGLPIPSDLAAKASIEQLKKMQQDLEPFVARVLYDGRRHYVYLPRGPTPAGHLYILRTGEEMAHKMYCDLADQRPHHAWRKHPVYGDWDDYILAEARRNPNLVRRELERKGQLVTCRRHFRIERNGRTEEGFAEATIDLILRGAVVGAKMGGSNGMLFGKERSRNHGEFVWENHLSGVCVLKSFDFSSEIAGHGDRTEFLLKEFSTTIPDEGEFVESKLRVRPGARVEDKVAGRTYTYKGRDVTQSDLDSAIRKSKSALRTKNE